MKISKILFYINLGSAMFLGIGWVYFYSFIILDDISRVPQALIANVVIAGLNTLFFISLVLLPFTYRHKKHRNDVRK